MDCIGSLYNGIYSTTKDGEGYCRHYPKGMNFSKASQVSYKVSVSGEAQNGYMVN